MPWDERSVEGYEEGASGGENRMPPDTPSSPPVARTSHLASLEKERDEYLDLAKRTKADFENFRKRVARQEAEAEMRGARRACACTRARARQPRAGTCCRQPGGRPSRAKACGSSTKSSRPCLHRAGVESYEPAGEAVRSRLARGDAHSARRRGAGARGAREGLPAERPGAAAGARRGGCGKE